MSQTGANNLRKAVFSPYDFKFDEDVSADDCIYVYISIAKRYGYCGRGDSINTTKLCTYYIGNAFVMFFVARWDYTRLYTNVYSESANVRVDIANRLKKITVIVFWKKKHIRFGCDDDGRYVAAYEEIFSHAVPAYICYRDFNNDHFCFDSQL